MDDAELLRDYAEDGCEEAFTALVRKHLDFVHSTALRLSRDPELAKDISQAVFIKLARKSGALRRPNALSGWLYRATCFEAADALRAECRRRRREEKAMSLSSVNPEPVPEWADVAPHLDEAMSRLKRLDQDAIVLRFFEKQRMAAVGQRLGLTEEAARKRVSRALEQMRVVLARRGLKVSASALGVAIWSNAAQASPAGWAATVAGTALASAGSGATVSGLSGTLSSLLRILAMTKVQATVMGLVFIAGLATPFVAVPLGNSQRSAGPELTLTSARSAESTSSAAADPRTRIQMPGSPALDRLTAWLLNMDQTQPRGVHSDELDAMIWTLTATDYPHAWQLGLKLHSSRLCKQFQEAVLKYWSKLDPLAALHAAESLPEGLARLKAVDSVLPAWVESAPSAALDWIRRSSWPENRRDYRTGLAIQAMAGKDPQGALAAIQELPSELERERAMMGVIARWTELAPEEAGRFVAQMPLSDQKSRLLGGLAMAWATQDPEAEAQWAETLTDLRERVNVIIPSIRGLVRKQQFLEAAEFLRRYESDFDEKPGEISNRCLTPILSHWVGSDATAAKNWVVQLPEGRLRDEALERLINYWSDEQPAAAAAFTAALPTGKIQQQGMKAALAGWCETDVQAAVDWVAGLPTGPTQQAAWSGLCAGLAGVRPRDAAEVVAGLPPGELQTQAALSVVNQWANQDPRSAAAWVAAFPNGQTRDRAAKAVLTFWTERDQPAATAWVQTLPESTRQYLNRQQ